MLRHTHIDRPLIGILFMLGFCVLAPLGDALAKVLGGRLDLGMLVLTRFAAQAAILLPIALLSGATLLVRGRVLALVTTRTLMHIAGISTMFTSLRYLPLADALAIAFVMPFVMLLLGKFVLGEEVGPHRLWASVVGFAGTLLVIQPNFAEVGAPALLPVGVAVIFALFMLVTRQIAKEVDPVALQAVSGLQASAILLPVLIFLPDLPGSGFAAFDLTTGWLLIALGSVGTAAHLLMTWSLRFAPASTLAPMQYLEIPFGTVIGWLIFRDLPNGLAALGILVTIGAGLYIILRERRLARS
jgi:drug/metabolite transporter (DMT)-like permease